MSQINMKNCNGLSKHPLYEVLRSMKKRCYNKTHPAFHNYGGRGITICDEWLNDFLSFYNWSTNNGYQKGLEIDRIDNNLGYSPDNCRWATRIEQQNNKRNNHYLTYNGKTQTVAQWSNEINIPHDTLLCRIKSKWSIEKVLTFPLRIQK